MPIMRPVLGIDLPFRGHDGDFPRNAELRHTSRACSNGLSRDNGVQMIRTLNA